MDPYRRIDRSRSNWRYKGVSPLSWVSDNSTPMGSLNSCLNVSMTAHIAPTQSMSRRLRIVATQSSAMNMADSWTCALKQIWLGTVPPHACSARSDGNNLNASALLNNILVFWSRTGWPFIVNCTTKDCISFTSGQRTTPNPSRCLLRPQPRLAQGRHYLFQIGDGREEGQGDGEGRVVGLLVHRGATVAYHHHVVAAVAGLPGGAFDHEVGGHSSQ